MCVRAVLFTFFNILVGAWWEQSLMKFLVNRQQVTLHGSSKKITHKVPNPYATSK